MKCFYRIVIPEGSTDFRAEVEDEYGRTLYQLDYSDLWGMRENGYISSALNSQYEVEGVKKYMLAMGVLHPSDDLQLLGNMQA